LVVGCPFVLRFPGLPPSLAPWTGAPGSHQRTWEENGFFSNAFTPGVTEP
jgi:hypothetical protein